MSLEVKITGQNPQRIRLIGFIDETVDLKEVFTQFKGDIVLDLGGVDKINSMGIHRWIPLMGEYSSQHKVVIERLSYPLVIQSNCILKLFGTAKIASCFAPYYCESCGQDQLVEVRKEDYLAENSKIPSSNCPSCKGEMTFDDLPHYFNFFKVY